MGSGAANSVITIDSRPAGRVRGPDVPLLPTDWIGMNSLRDQIRTIRSALERNVPVLLGRQGLALGAQGAQRPGDREPGFGRADDRVDVAAFGRDVGV